MQLREHQVKAFQDGVHAIKRREKPLIVLGTGGGKTAIGATFARSAARQDGRTVITAPYVTLIKQWAESLMRFGGFHQDEIGILQGSNSDTAEFLSKCPVVVAMAQSLNSDRGRQLLQDNRFQVGIYDERHLGHLDTAELLLRCPVNIGFTATPIRVKGQDILDEYKWIEPISSRTLVQQGWLSQFRHYIYSQTHLINPKGSGDYNDDEQGEILQNITPEFVFKEWCRIYTPHKDTIAFCGTIAQAEEYAAYFNRMGIKSEVVCKDTPDSDRNRIIRGEGDFIIEEEHTPGFKTIRERFRSGEVQVIFSVTKLAIGFDEPTAKCALILRPTVSEALWIQMFGRVLRIIPGLSVQPVACVMDFAGCGLKLPLPTEIESYTEYMQGKKKRVSRQAIVDRENLTRRVSVGEFIQRNLQGKMIARRDPYLINDDTELLRELRHQAFWVKESSPSYAWAGYCAVRKTNCVPKHLWYGEGGGLEGSIFEDPTIECFLAYLNYLSIWKDQRKPEIRELWVRDEVRKEFGVQGLIWLRQLSVLHSTH